jgi:iron-sulfur cluster repair protein YtfE (RIC family)
MNLRLLGGMTVAKKAKAKKKTAKSSNRKVKAKAAPKRSARKAKKAAPKPRPTKASKTKVAARAAATRNPKPAPKQSGVKTAAKVAVGMALLAVDAITKRLPWAKDENDPLELLKTDHRHFEKLLKEGEDTTERAKKGRREILKALTKDLNVHEAIEEQILYPALEPHAEAHDVVLEGSQEHHVADIQIKELHDVATDDEQWGAKFKVLKESIEHHISEEENRMFPAARGVLAKEELLALGARMRKLKTELER